MVRVYLYRNQVNWKQDDDYPDYTIWFTIVPNILDYLITVKDNWNYGIETDSQVLNQHYVSHGLKARSHIDFENIGYPYLMFRILSDALLFKLSN